MVEIVKLPIQKLKVVHVARYLVELILRIKQRVRLRQIILVSVIQRRMKGRMCRAFHRAVSGSDESHAEVFNLCVTAPTTGRGDNQSDVAITGYNLRKDEHINALKNFAQWVHDVALAEAHMKK